MSLLSTFIPARARLCPEDTRGSGPPLGEPLFSRCPGSLGRGCARCQVTAGPILPQLPWGGEGLPGGSGAESTTPPGMWGYRWSKVNVAIGSRGKINGGEKAWARQR